MDITTTKDENASQVALKIFVTAEEFEPYLDRAARELSKGSPLKGFRPGKASLSVALEAFGKDRVITEALENAIPRWFMQAVVEQKIDALGRPSTAIDQASVEDGVAFTATVDVLPEVILGDMAAITAQRRGVEVTDQELDKELMALAKSRSTFLDVARPAAVGDTVVVDFKVSLDGEVMEGGESKNHPVHLGEGHFVPDFEQKLQGIRADDTREFTLMFPDDFANKELRGRQAIAAVKAHRVQSRVIPELTDEFAQSLGKFADMQELKQQLRENMSADRLQRERERLHGDLTDQLAKRAQFSALPESLIEREIDRRVAELSQMLVWQQKTLEQYVTDQGKTLAQLRDELREPAEKTVKVSLALRQFAQDNNVVVEDAEVELETQAYVQQQATAGKKSDIDIDELRVSIAHMLRNRKSLALLESIATITEAKAEANEKQEVK